MKCSDCRTMLPALIEGDLSGPDLRKIEDHLEACADCRRERSLLSRSVEAVKCLKPVRAPRAMGPELRRRLMAESRPPVWSRRGWMAVAACLAALVLVSWPWWLQMPIRTDMLSTEAPRDDGVRSLGLEPDFAISDESAPGVLGGQLLVRVSLRVDEIDPALSEVSAFVLESGGHVDRGYPVPDGFSLSVLIPDDRLHALLRRLSDLGTLEWEELRGEGLEEQLAVTGELVSILEEMVDAERARDPGGEELIALVEKLADARGRLESIIKARSEVRIEINLGTD